MCYGQSPNATPTPTWLLPVLLRERRISGRDAAFATELTYGTCRTRGLLDAVIGAAADRSPDSINPVLLDLLRLGTYQLLRTRVDAHAAVSTTVEQAGIEFDSARAGFVNGVLRTISGRDEQSWVDELAPDRSADPVGHAAFVHAHPRWIAQAFVDALGAAAGELDAALASDDERPQVHLAARPGALTADRAGRCGRWQRRPVLAVCGVPAGRRPRAVGAGARRPSPGPGRRQPTGGPRAHLAPVDGDDAGRWLDLCAGPGGKTALVAALAPRRAPGLPRWSRRSTAPTWLRRTPVACRSRCCGPTDATAAWNRVSTGCWSTCRAPGWVRCAADRSHVGGGSPPTSRR